MHSTLTTISDRLEIVTVPHTARTATFGEDVAAGLGASQKHLSSKYFYDDLGSALFDAITHLPEYYLTRAETEILHESGWEIVRALEEPVEFLELGSGSAVKTRILIDEALRAQGTLRYSPIDISADALESSARSLVDAYPQLRIRGYAADYFDVLGSPELTHERRVLAMFMGSNIGNYDPTSADALLKKMNASLRPGDGLLIGADLRIGRARSGLRRPDRRHGVRQERPGAHQSRTRRHVRRARVRTRRDLRPDTWRGRVVRIDPGATRAHQALGLTIAFAAGERITPSRPTSSIATRWGAWPTSRASASRRPGPTPGPVRRASLHQAQRARSALPRGEAPLYENRAHRLILAFVASAVFAAQPVCPARTSRGPVQIHVAGRSQMSPDGKWVVVGSQHLNPQKNTYQSSLLLVNVATGASRDATKAARRRCVVDAGFARVRIRPADKHHKPQIFTYRIADGAIVSSPTPRTVRAARSSRTTASISRTITDR